MSDVDVDVDDNISIINVCGQMTISLIQLASLSSEATKLSVGSPELLSEEFPPLEKQCFAQRAKKLAWVLLITISEHLRDGN